MKPWPPSRRWLGTPAQQKPRFFAPDQKTPGQQQKLWVQGDVWARLNNNRTLIFTEAVWVEDGVLKRGQRLSSEKANEKYRGEITAYLQRVASESS